MGDAADMVEYARERGYNSDIDYISDCNYKAEREAMTSALVKQEELVKHLRSQIRENDLMDDVGFMQELNMLVNKYVAKHTAP